MAPFDLDGAQNIEAKLRGHGYQELRTNCCPRCCATCCATFVTKIQKSKNIGTTRKNLDGGSGKIFGFLDFRPKIQKSKNIGTTRKHLDGGSGKIFGFLDFWILGQKSKNTGTTRKNMDVGSGEIFGFLDFFFFILYFIVPPPKIGKNQSFLHYE